MTIVTVLLIITIVSTTNIFAYVRFNQGYVNAPNIPIKYYGYINTNYKAEFEDAIDSWNNSSEANIYFSSSTDNLVMQSSIADTCPAEYIYAVPNQLYWPGPTKIGYEKFWISLNDYALSSYSTRAIQSTCCHELGHALKLYHTDNNAVSIMNTNRNKYLIYEPQQDDINGVNDIQ